MRVRLSTVLLAVLALVTLGWLVQLLGDEGRAVARRLRAVGDLIEKAPGESALVAANRARRLGESVFARDFVVRLEPFDQVVRDRQGVMRTLAVYRRGPERIGIRFRDPWTEVAPGGQRAEQTFVVVVSARWPERTAREAYRFRVVWVREEGTWRIREAVMLEVLEGARALF